MVQNVNVGCGHHGLPIYGCTVKSYGADDPPDEGLGDMMLHMNQICQITHCTITICVCLHVCIKTVMGGFLFCFFQLIIY